MKHTQEEFREKLKQIRNDFKNIELDYNEVKKILVRIRKNGLLQQKKKKLQLKTKLS